MPPRRAEHFRVLSYNLLADCYSRFWDEAGSVHAYCSPRLTRPEWRMARLLEEVLAFAPDVVLLQEVDVTWYEQHWAPVMEARGYTGVFTKKRNEGSSEGVASFVRTATFELVETRPLALSLDAHDAPTALAPLLVAHTATAAGVSRLPTVAQLLLLREAPTAASSPSASAPPRHILVANTHLYFSNPGMHVRVMQTAKILEHAHAWAAQLPAAEAPALLLAGDLNSESTDAVVRLLTTGFVEADDPDWLHGLLNWAPSLDLASAAKYAAHDAALVAAAVLGLSVEAPTAQVLQQAAACAERGAGGTAELEAELEAAWAWQLRRVEAANDALRSTSLDGARYIACELHLLRRAMERLLARPPRHLDACQLAATVVIDAANSRSLLNSEALAAAEVARQLQLPLGTITRGLPTGADSTNSWYTRAHTRLGELTEQLVSAKVALRAQVASEVGRAEAAAGEGGKVATAHWVNRAAGVHLTQSTPLDSAYGLHAQPTHAVPGYANTLDWICVDAASLDVVGVAPLPPLEELTRDVAMPSAEWPSDHVSLCCDLAWRDPAEKAVDRSTTTGSATASDGVVPPSRTSRGAWAAEAPTAAGSWIWRASRMRS